MIITNDVLLEGHVNGVHWHERALVVDGQLAVFRYDVLVDGVDDLGERVVIVLAIQVDDEAVDVLATINIQSNLAILVGEAEVARRSKHQLTAAHVVVHTVLEDGLQRVRIQFVKVN